MELKNNFDASVSMMMSANFNPILILKLLIGESFTKGLNLGGEKRFLKKVTLREKCSYSLSFSGLYFSAFGLNTEMLCISPYSVRMRENNDQKNSEYGHFPRSVIKGVFKTLSIMYTVMDVFAKTGDG